MNGKIRDFDRFGHLYSRVDHEPDRDMSIPHAAALAWMDGMQRQAMRGPAVRYQQFMGSINRQSESRNPGLPATYKGWTSSALTLWGASLGIARFKPYPIKANPGAAPK